MKKTTRRLASQVQRALLDLPDALLLATIDGWLRELNELLEDSDGSYGLLGYRPRSEATGRTSASLEVLDETEPQAEEFCWLPPAAPVLRATLRAMQPTRVYHTVVALAGEVFLRKPFAATWGEPPGGQSDGYSFMKALVGYLALRRAAGDIPLEQFEAQYSEQLEALAAASSPTEGRADPSTSDLFPNERRWHLRIVFLHPSEQQRHNLLQALQQYDCTIQQGQGEQEIAGYVSYFLPPQRVDLDVLVRIRRLLNRWQREGRITWTGRKQKPARRQRARKQKKKVKVKGA